MDTKKFMTLAISVCAVMASTSASALVVNTTNDGTLLANTILGSGISISGVSYNGAAGASGTFSDGLSSGIGIGSGIILTSGSAASAVGPNSSDGTTTDNGLAGDADLNTLIPGYSTYDATTLEFDFNSTGGDVYFNYVFASEEYNEYVGSPFNDVFGFFLDGSNIALIPGTTTPVAINTVNCGANGITPAPNCSHYNNNDPTDSLTPFNLEYDGFTDVFTASFLGLSAGSHHIKLAIADAGDTILDSAVFIQAGSFSDKPPVSVPEPGTIALMGAGLIGFSARRRKTAKH